MADDRRRVDTYYARGMLEIRSTLHLALRLTLRANQVLERSGAASERSGFWRLALPGFVLLDVAIWRYLRRSEHSGLAWRVPLDALDAAFWTLSPLPPSGHSDPALLIVIPLAVEAGVRLGWRALLVPGAVLASTTAAAVAVGKPIQLMGVIWIVLAAAVGMGFFRYCRHLDERTEGERRRVLAAAQSRAYLAGQNHVAMGASSAVDVIEGLVPVLGRPQPGSALWRLADGWKGRLSASTAQEVRYLQVAVLEWERSHNSHPDLSGLVRVQVGEGHGTTLLTASQGRQLGQALEGLALRGAVTVRLGDTEARRLPGQALELAVNGRPVQVPPDRREAPSPIDVAAVAYCYAGALVAAWLLPSGGSLPPLPVAAGLAVCATAGLFSHRRTVERGQKTRLTVSWLAMLVGTILTLLSRAARSPFSVDGVPILGFGISLILLSFLAGFYWRSLPRWRWLFPMAMGAQVVVGVLVFPAPGALTSRSMLASVLYNVFPFFPCLHLARSMEHAANRHAASIEEVDAEAEHAAFLDGQESVIGLVRQARNEALAELQRLGPRLDIGMVELATDRLEEVGRRLRTIGP